MSDSYGLIIEGAMQILVAVLALATIIRRGKNPYLSLLAFCFAFSGILVFFPFIANEVSVIFGTNVGELFAHYIQHGTTFYSVGVYIVVMLVVVYGPRVFKKSAITALCVATIFFVGHLLHLKVFNLGNYGLLESLSEWVLFIFLYPVLIANICPDDFIFVQITTR